MATQKELLYKVLDNAQHDKRDREEERKVVESHLLEMKRVQKDMTNQIGMIQDVISDPVTGLIVSTNKNTEWRARMSEEFKQLANERTEQTRLLDELGRWKSVMDKAMWITFTAIVGIVLKMILFP